MILIMLKKLLYSGYLSISLKPILKNSFSFSHKGHIDAVKSV